MRTPVLNPSHRGVLDEAEQASLLVTVRELCAVLDSLKQKHSGQDRRIWELAE